MRHGSTFVKAAAAVFVCVSVSLQLASPVIARDDHPPLPDARLGVRTAPLLLLSRPDVRADLGLTDDQSRSAERAITELYVSAAALKGKTGPQVVAGRKAIDDGQRLWFERNLSPGQRQRLLQVELQWEGMSALVSRPVVIETVGLTPDQKSVIAQAVTKRNDARARKTYTRADEEALSRHALSVLSAAQRERWKSMLGREFVPQIASTSRPAAPKR